MRRRPRRRVGRPMRGLAAVVVVALLATVGSVLAPTTAWAAGTVVFNNLFNNRTLDGTGSVTKPTSPSAANGVCLTVSGNNNSQPLVSCSGASDAQGSGKLRLTSAAVTQVGSIFGLTTLPM